jgi:hypothetical protein
MVGGWPAVHECHHLGKVGLAPMASRGSGLKFKGKNMAGVGISSAVQQLSNHVPFGKASLVCTYLDIK